jgi:hypothetical protein
MSKKGHPTRDHELCNNLTATDNKRPKHSGVNEMNAKGDGT